MTDVVEAPARSSAPPDLEVAAPPRPAAAAPPARRRFTVAALVGLGLALVPYLWVLWDDWSGIRPLRYQPYEGNFYDLQARAMLHGHFYLPNGSVGLEAFIHDGHQYTYFGLFPSIIRMPVLLFTSSLDAHLTTPSMLLAWLVTGLFASLLLWRVRVLVRGDAVMGRAEAFSVAAFLATVGAGTVIVYLAATPYVFDEDLAWSVALTLGALFALLGVLERPSWRRVALLAAFVLATNLDRITFGWACALGAGMAAVWFGVGRGGDENRRWWLPLLVVGVVPVVLSCAINWMKFGLLVNLPMADQVFTHLNAYRRQFLASNGGQETGIRFVPSNLLAYLQPFGLRFTSAFPFVTLPAAPAAELNGVLFDRTYPTASVPASMPLLFLLGCWGLISSFRPRPGAGMRLVRIPLAVAVLGGGTILAWGYIADRYLADFVPILVAGGAVGLVDIWRRLDGRSRRVRISGFGCIAVLALFGIVANTAAASTPSDAWNPGQTLAYLQAQKTVSDLTGHPLSSFVSRGSSLPGWAPAGRVFVVGDCAGLYVSNGESFSTIPLQAYQHATWMPAEYGPPYMTTLQVSLASGTPLGTTIPLVSVGSSTLALRVSGRSGSGQLKSAVVLLGNLGAGLPIYFDKGRPVVLTLITDQAEHEASVVVDSLGVFDTEMRGVGPVVVHTTGSAGAAPGAADVRQLADPPAATALCRSLLPGK